jgi:hypothetical protein
MAKSKIVKERESLIAGWLYDSFSHPDEVEGDFKPDARDLINFLKSHGWELHKTQNGERPPF